MKKLFSIIVILISVLIPVFFVAGYLNRPSFEVINYSQKDVKGIRVYWRDKSRDISGIKSGQREKIYINSEAAARFEVTFSDSKVIKSDEIYFTGGTKVIVGIYNNEVKLSYNFQKDRR